MIRRVVSWLIAHPRLTALLGAVSISFSGILYRVSETTPETAAFFRCLYALPILLLAAWFERREVGALPRRSLALAAGADRAARRARGRGADLGRADGQ